LSENGVFFPIEKTALGKYIGKTPSSLLGLITPLEAIRDEGYINPETYNQFKEKGIQYSLKFKRYKVENDFDLVFTLDFIYFKLDSNGRLQLAPESLEALQNIDEISGTSFATPAFVAKYLKSKKASLLIQPEFKSAFPIKQKHLNVTDNSRAV
jgi:hypothetical protein